MNDPLQDAKNNLVRRWGEMGGYWGINRTMAELHALLFVTRKPLCTDDVMDQLKISRGNASMNLRALVDWGLISRTHQLGDRKEYFVADTDIWHMFETIMRERRRREVEPIIATIGRCVEMVRQRRPGNGVDAEDIQEFQRRLEELREFLGAMGGLFDLMLRFGRDGFESVTKQIAASQGLAEGMAASNGAKASEAFKPSDELDPVGGRG